ncbi:MAG: ribosomal protein L7/L12 [Candidatus Obscuribacterales bacterium]|nr:ribosomal protein L7/L12 [Candidatus Obscuribacterales bacterium]
MKIRVWNAFASNNSGSYTIVGSFPNAELATEVASELAILMKAHTEWLEAESSGAEKNADDSPLSKFIQQHNLRSSNLDYPDQWPHYSDDNTPKVVAVDAKVIIHHEYTVTLPREFGEYFYARGGRVEHELNHAHNPIVAVCQVWMPWSDREGKNLPEKIQAVVEELCEAGGEFLRHAASERSKIAPAWRDGDGLHDPDLVVGAVFDDLVAGFAAVNRIARKHGFRTFAKVSEAFDESDSLAFLRPCSPRPLRGLFSVILEEKGPTPDEVVKVLEFALAVDRNSARKMLDSAPITILSGFLPEKANEVAGWLRNAGATSSVLPE